MRIMRFRKKITKGFSISLGKKKSSANVGGFNIPISTNKAVSPKNEGSKDGCITAFAFVFGGFVLLSIGMAVVSKFTDKSNSVKTDSLTASPIFVKPHKNKRRHTKKVYSNLNIDTIIGESPLRINDSVK